MSAQGQAPTSAGDLAALLDGAKVIVTCGAGGVGKTTVAAALGLAAVACREGRVLVLTVDPARRLAGALGLDGVGDTPTQVGVDVLDRAGWVSRGELHVAMLDMKQSWDNLIRRHAPDAATSTAILANPLYQNLTSTFVRSHDYIAAERLHDLTASGRWDLVVVDTPPSRSALDFLDAPGRMADFFASRLLRWLIAPYRSRLVGAASKPFIAVADRVLGAQFLADIAEFFLLFQSMYGGFVTRSRAVEASLREPTTRFVLVTTAEPLPAREASRFAGELANRRFRLGAVVANRLLPGSLRSTEGADASAWLAVHAERAGEATKLWGVDPASSARVLREVSASYEAFRRVAVGEARRELALAEVSPLLLRVPRLGLEITDVAAVSQVARHLML